MFLISGRSSLVNLTRSLKSQTLHGHFERRLTFPGQRYATTTSTGAYLEEPKSTPLGWLKMIVAVLPGLYVGALISKSCAAFLEENDIFVPADDDDDD